MSTTRNTRSPTLKIKTLNIKTLNAWKVPTPMDLKSRILRSLHINTLIVAVLSAVLLFAGIDKLLHYQGFVNALRDYVLVPKGVAAYAAMPLILVEIMLGVTLWMKRWRRPTLAAIGSLFVIFIVALLVNYLYGRRGICGCWFTFTLAQSNEMHILQNLFLASMAFIVWSDPEPGSGTAGDTAAATESDTELLDARQA